MQSLDAERLTDTWDVMLAWLESAYPSLQPIFLRRRWRVDGPRLVVATASELEAELIAANREPLQQQLATLLGLHATALATEVQPELAPAPTEQPLTLDERRRRLEAENPHFVLFQQTFQTFYDP